MQKDTEKGLAQSTVGSAPLAAVTGRFFVMPDYRPRGQTPMPIFSKTFLTIARLQGFAVGGIFFCLIFLSKNKGTTNRIVKSIPALIFEIVGETRLQSIG